MADRDRTPLLGIAAAGLLGGAIAGAAAAVIDGLWSWRALGQFLPGVGGKLELLVYLATTHALPAALVVSLGASAVVLLGRHTRLGGIARAAAAAHRERPQVGLSLVAAGIPITGVLLIGAYAIGTQALAARKHIGLMLGSAMVIALAACATAAVISFAVARPLEPALARLLRIGRLRERFAHPGALGWTAVVLIAAGGSLVIWRAWDTVRLLQIRGAWVALAFALLVPGALRIGERMAAALARKRAAVRPLAIAGGAAALLVVALAVGASDGVRKAAASYSGLGGALTRLYQRLGDVDRDGYSRFLGGGDCDDFDRDVNPGASEVPDDGEDNNCVGGDATIERSLDEVAFTAVPEFVPDDFNVLLVTIDTLRADHVGAYGYDRATTPAIDRVAAEGTVFVNAWAHAPSTRYSMPAILTGRHPLEVDYVDIPRQWPGIAESNTTIAEILRARGLATGAILNYWYFDELRRMNQGFDHYDNTNKRLHKAIPGQGPAKTSGSSAREQTDKALEFVGEHAGERFFLWVHYYDPHYEYQAHPGTQSFGSAEIDMYDQEIRFTDDQLARVLDDLRARGLWDRTVIAITGDHGEGFGEHGIELHGYHLYAPQTKIPLIIRVPGAPPRAVSMPAGHVDLLPTLANLAGAPASAEMRGRSLVDVITGTTDPDRDRTVFQQLSFENDNEQRGAASRSCHVIYNVSPSTSWEIYRLDRDPEETRDLSGDPGPCAATRAALERWYDASEIPPGAVAALVRDPLPVARRLDIDFGDEVRLVAVDLPSEPVRRGETFDAVFLWEARGRLRGGWKVFAHFEAKTGGRFLGDHAPVRPFDWWRRGDTIRYTQKVTIPASTRAGAYTLWVGLFRDAQRLPARSGAVDVRDDRAPVGTVEVVP